MRPPHVSLEVAPRDESHRCRNESTLSTYAEHPSRVPGRTTAESPPPNALHRNLPWVGVRVTVVVGVVELVVSVVVGVLVCVLVAVDVGVVVAVVVGVVSMHWANVPSARPLTALLSTDATSSQSPDAAVALNPRNPPPMHCTAPATVPLLNALMAALSATAVSSQLLPSEALTGTRSAVGDVPKHSIRPLPLAAPLQAS